MKISNLSRREQLAILGGLSIFLAVVEFMIPKPLPFMRIGIANIPLLISLTIFKDREVWTLALLKIAGQGIINGTFFSYIILFSGAGTAMSVLVMLLLRRICGGLISLVGISVMGALAGNGVQILLATIIIFGDAALLIAPPFLIIGVISGTVIGLFSDAFVAGSRWVREAGETG
jgi:heptaprenyl diphosphate synthase